MAKRLHRRETPQFYGFSISRARASFRVHEIFDALMRFILSVLLMQRMRARFAILAPFKNGADLTIWASQEL